MNHSDRAPWRGYFALSIVWLAVLAGALLFTRRPAPEPIVILPPPTLAPTETPQSTPLPLPTATPRPLRVDVAGAVMNPHVCTLPAGSIVADAIEAAGGPAPGADLDRVNKAIELQDGMQVYVPRLAESRSLPPISTSPPPQMPPAAQRAPAPAAPLQAAPAKLIDLNTASQAELESLPGVGPKTAQLIIEGRPYGKVDDLLAVKGIGPATLDKLRDLVTVQ